MWYACEIRKINTFWRGNLKEGDHSEDIGVGGRIILKLKSVDCIHLAKDSDQQLGLVNRVMNLRDP
jgi:hypothetical protein